MKESRSKDDKTDYNPTIAPTEHRVNRNAYEKSDYSNPCLREQELSYKCLSENNYDKTKCGVVFANYKNCKHFWGDLSLERRRKGIVPYLPLPEDRDEILRKHREGKLKT